MIIPDEGFNRMMGSPFDALAYRQEINKHPDDEPCHSHVALGGHEYTHIVVSFDYISLKPIFHCDAKKLRWALALA